MANPGEEPLVTLLYLNVQVSIKNDAAQKETGNYDIFKEEKK